MNGDATSKIMIPLSKGKIALLLLGSVGFVVLSLWLWSVADTQALASLFLRLLAVSGIAFFGLCGIFACIKLFDGRPGLIIDDEGIVDNSSAAAVGRIPWNEITGIRVSEISGHLILTIDVIDPQKYLKRSHFLVRIMNAGSVSMVGSPINISVNGLNVNFDELEQILTAAFERYRGVD